MSASTLFTALTTLAALVFSTEGACLGTKPAVFHDMQAGDYKVITGAGFGFDIQPYNRSQKWVVYGTFDVNCVANIDFKEAKLGPYPNPPPVNLTMSLWIMESKVGTETTLGFEFTDPSSTLAPPDQPINFWLQRNWPKPEAMPKEWEKLRSGKRAVYEGGDCTSSGVVDDMHDGDKKALKVSGNSLEITPSGNQQKWKVDTKFNSDCVASVNFNVPGKPGPPPVPLNAKVWGMVAIAGGEKDAILFSDPSSTIAPAKTTLNVWIPNNK